VFVISGYPKPPIQVTLSEVALDSVVLSWKNTSSPRYVLVLYRPIDSHMTIMCDELFESKGPNRARVSGLSEYTNYEFYIVFLNNDSCSETSEPRYARTEPPGTALYRALTSALN